MTARGVTRQELAIVASSVFRQRHSRVDQILRMLQASDAIPKTKAGRGATRLGFRDVAVLLIALIPDCDPPEAASYHDYFAHLASRRSEDGTEQIEAIPLPDLPERGNPLLLSEGASLVDAIAHLLERVSSPAGESERLQFASMARSCYLQIEINLKERTAWIHYLGLRYEFSHPLDGGDTHPHYFDHVAEELFSSERYKICGLSANGVHAFGLIARNGFVPDDHEVFEQ